MQRDSVDELLRPSAAVNASKDDDNKELFDAYQEDDVPSTPKEGFDNAGDLSSRKRHRRQHSNGSSVTQNESMLRRKERAEAVKRRKRREFAKEMVSQTVPMLALSCLGSVLAGEIVSRLKTWPVFQRVPELFILVPILLNLKGNIEMNLAARFSTSANIGELDIRLTRRTLVIGNLALLQVQALLVSLLAGIIAFALGLASRHTALPDAVIPGHAINENRGDYFECLLVLCASMLAASLSSAVVGSFMCALVIVSRKLGINPDNIATPLAASLGDLLSLTVLGLVSSWFIGFIGSFVSTAVFLVLLAFVALNVWITMRNAYVQELLWSGWIPLISAMIISSGTGLVLESFVNVFKGYALLSPVVTGVAGNVGAILVSRISTSLHSNTFQSSPHTLTGLTLFVLSTPVLCLFLVFADVTNQVDPSFLFGLLYVIVCVLTIGLALVGAYVISVILWKMDLDPDTHALPIMSAAMDVFGQVLLAVAFVIGGMKAPQVVVGETADGVSTNITEIITDTTTNLLRRALDTTYR